MRRHGATGIRNSTTSLHSSNSATTRTDILVVGAGIAGLTFALTLPETVSVLVVTKAALGESNTRYAQGGLAAAIGDDDSSELHLADTIRAGAGLVDVDAARVLVEGAGEAVRWLTDQGAKFDRHGDGYIFGNEGAHSRARVLHAGGDATGAEIERALVSQLERRSNLTVIDHATMTDLHVQDGRCTGAAIWTGKDVRGFDVSAAVTMLATGGAGHLWAVTSNPPGATGDGIALAMLAGATVADLECTQFHPTVLDLSGHDPFLISEAARGDGAILRNDDGERFMRAIDDRAELAPRDIVARAIQLQILSGSKVWLDLRHLEADYIRARFPTIGGHLADAGIDLTTDLVPVAPAAHYFVGGIAATPEGRTTLPGLLAVGEVACTGVHGANRLASNSLLEGLVFGRRAAQAVGDEGPILMPEKQFDQHSISPTIVRPDRVSTTSGRIPDLMRQHVSVIWSEASLTAARDALRTIAAQIQTRTISADSRSLNSMLLLAAQITESALFRRESRGGHFRSDYPNRDPSLAGQHQLVVRTSEGEYMRTYGTINPQD